jgi:hypothetical protein
MRAVVGLVGLLAVVGIIMMIMGKGGGLDAVDTARKAQESARVQTNQISGRDAEGAKASDSGKFEVQSVGGKPDSILVVKLDAGGTLERVYGLKRNDSIVEAGRQGGVMMRIRDIPSFDAAEEVINEAFAFKQPLIVVRDGQKLELPYREAAGNKKTASSDPLQNQLNAIQNAPGR